MGLFLLEKYKIDAQEDTYGFRTIEFTENVKFDVEISPFSSGVNTILVKVSDDLKTSLLLIQIKLR